MEGSLRQDDLNVITKRIVQVVTITSVVTGLLGAGLVAGRLLSTLDALATANATISARMEQHTAKEATHELMMQALRLEVDVVRTRLDRLERQAERLHGVAP